MGRNRHDWPVGRPLRYLDCRSVAQKLTPDGTPVLLAAEAD